jgi:hypothetical protein
MDQLGLAAMPGGVLNWSAIRTALFCRSTNAGQSCRTVIDYLSLLKTSSAPLWIGMEVVREVEGSQFDITTGRSLR